ncbi:MAG TPA: PQQ-dependent dehydrogenase, methanol/ethanol family [Hyphomonadaceae bacterium]|nr:PQQ-dependent dehydrogenase, methanol/ethanol family [Hyphomonadaceae bacterium]
MKFGSALLAGAALLAMAACSEKSKTAAPLTVAQVDGSAIQAADQRPDVWLSTGRTYTEQRYSPLKQIDAKNIGQLGLAWFAELDTNRGMEATPLVVDGVMYVTSAWSVVYALDAKTGERKWTYDPHVDKARGQKACCDVVNRGVAIYKGKVYVGTIDARLIALDAATGKEVWSQVTADQSKPYTITGAPRVVKGNVLIGNGGAEFGVRGYLTAYDAETGKQAWRFYMTPNPEKKPDGAASDKFWAEKGNATWGDKGEWTESGGGGTPWDAIVYDPDLNLVYIGGGNGSPWNQRLRDPEGKDNLFLSSIVALHADTGEYAWHYQTTPGETWDYTATQPIILADLKIGDKVRKVLMQAPKNGFFYVIDRQTGELISADKYQDNLTWATGVDMKTGRPIEAPNARYEMAETALHIPGPLGSHNWHPMSFSPDTGLVYIPAHTLPTIYANMDNFKYRPGYWNTGTDFTAAALPTEAAARAAAAAASKGQLVAWDPVARKPKWTHDYPNAWNGGVLTTAGGLVFQGALDGHFRAFNAADGTQLWDVDGEYPVLSGPISYEIGGEQYVAVTAGWGTALPLAGGTGQRMGSAEKGRVIVYKIGGKATLPPYETFPVDQAPTAPDFGSAAQVARGKELYFQNCMVCHGDGVQSGGLVVDLRWSENVATKDLFKDVVLGGKFATAGMAPFQGALSPEDIETIRAYIVSRAHEDADAAKKAATPAKPK